MADCLFCKIAMKKIPADVVYEDDKIIAFKDIQPVAPVHVLIIPKEHIASIVDIEKGHAEVTAHMMVMAKKIAQDLGVADKGFRIVNNCGEDGGQTVAHIHFHILGGRALQWPPG